MRALVSCATAGKLRSISVNISKQSDAQGFIIFRVSSDGFAKRLTSFEMRDIPRMKYNILYDLLD